jgi:DNA modification methylase
MAENPIPIDQIILGDCLQVLTTIPEKAIDLIFADPPYNLQLEKELWRPNSTRVSGVEESWDQFTSFEAYDNFTKEWLLGCRRVLKDAGTIWVIGSYHNIFRVGRILQDLGFWILNDVVWIKNNPMPNFRGVRFTNAHETLIWAQKNKGNRYTFNYEAMKSINHKAHGDDGLQMRSDWMLPLCRGKERLRVNGEKAHPTQKPESLLERVIISSTNLGDLVLDPFFGTGTTGAVAKKLGRHWIGIEVKSSYISIAQQRIDLVTPNTEYEESLSTKAIDKQKRIPFFTLLQTEILKEGQILYFGLNSECQAQIMADGNLRYGDFTGSIHKVGREILKAPCNGWMAWYYIDKETGKREPIDHLRKIIQNEKQLVNTPKNVKNDGEQ